MQIINVNTIGFKSVDVFFHKELSGTKPNTVRRLDDVEKRTLNLWFETLREKGLKPMIRISLIYSKENFEREITDISEWEGLHIFSWSR